MNLIKDPKHADNINAKSTMYPTAITCLKEGGFHAENTSTIYGICTEATKDVWIYPMDKTFSKVSARVGTVFTMPGGFDTTCKGEFTIFVIERLGYRGLFGLSQVENRGRLAYIDGCSDTLIFPPARCGDPCLNTLHFPPGINQTQHLHPDIRVGVVLDGGGIAYKNDVWNEPLVKGAMFILEESEIHSFKTDKTGMTVVAYHPTTDTGPTDQSHPMINRTYIDHGKQ